MSSEKTSNDPVCVLVSSKSSNNIPLYSKCIIHQRPVRCTTTKTSSSSTSNPMMSKPSNYPLIERLNAIITSSFSSAGSSPTYNGKKCGESNPNQSTENKLSCRSIDVATGIIECNGMSDFEYEDFSLDSLDSIFEDTPIEDPTKEMNTADAYPSDSGNSSPPISNIPFCMNAKTDIKDDFNVISFPSAFHCKPGTENLNYGHPFFHYSGRSCNSVGIDPTTLHPNTINMNNHNNSSNINHGTVNSLMNDNMLELQPPPFPLDTLQSPVTDMPGFEWCSNLDWNENASYETPITPSLPYSAYHTHSSVAPSECTNGSGTNAALGPIPPLELINPLQIQDEKFAYSGYPQDMSHTSSNNHNPNNDLNVLGVDLSNLMQGHSSLSDANARLLTDLNKSSLPLHDNHFTPPPSPTDTKLFRTNNSSNVREYKPPRKRIVISKANISTPRRNKKVVPREIKANHMDCHDYTNKVQYTKIIPRTSNITSTSSTRITNSTRLNPIPLDNDSLRQTPNYVTTTSAMNISLSPKNPFRNTDGMINRVEDIRRKISEIDDPEYLAHGTGIPR